MHINASFVMITRPKRAESAKVAVDSSSSRDPNFRNVDRSDVEDLISGAAGSTDECACAFIYMIDILCNTPSTSKLRLSSGSGVGRGGGISQLA